MGPHQGRDIFQAWTWGLFTAPATDVTLASPGLSPPVLAPGPTGLPDLVGFMVLGRLPWLGPPVLCWIPPSEATHRLWGGRDRPWLSPPVLCWIPPSEATHRLWGRQASPVCTRPGAVSASMRSRPPVISHQLADDSESSRPFWGVDWPTLQPPDEIRRSGLMPGGRATGPCLLLGVDRTRSVVSHLGVRGLITLGGDSCVHGWLPHPVDNQVSLLSEAFRQARPRLLPADCLSAGRASPPPFS